MKRNVQESWIIIIFQFKRWHCKIKKFPIRVFFLSTRAVDLVYTEVLQITDLLYIRFWLVTAFL